MCEWHFLSLKLTETFPGKKSLPKIEGFNSLDKPFINSNNFDGGLLRMRNHAWYQVTKKRTSPNDDVTRKLKRLFSSYHTKSLADDVSSKLYD